MTVKAFVKKLFSLRLWGNLLAMALVIVGLAFGTMKAIDLYTHHGQHVEVPNVKGLQLADAEYNLSKLDLEAVVIDSGYVRSKPAGCVLEQTPVAGDKVKSGRVIYLTINASSSPTLPMPDVADNSSLREAEARLRAMGFKLNPHEYIDGEKDWVYGVKSRGHNVVSGQRVPIDVPLTLQVGNGRSSFDQDSIDFIDAEPSYNPQEDEQPSTVEQQPSQPSLVDY